MYLPLVILSAFAFVYSILSGKLEKLPFSGPILFIFFGGLVGPLGFNVLSIDTTLLELKALADLVLALFLFSDAASVNRRTLEASLHIPLRMLCIGLPGVILLGAGIAKLMFPELSLWSVALLATMLAATDAALGKPVVVNKQLPEQVRMSLNVESGLNDGLCVPILFVFIALASSTGHNVWDLAFSLIVKEIGIGLLVGIGITGVGLLLGYFAWRAGYITKLWGQMSVTFLSLLCFSAAESVHGSGYIAAFAGGLLFGYVTRRLSHQLVLDTEGFGEGMAMLTWVLFGSIVVPAVIAHISGTIVLYAVLSLTVIRMLPILLSLAGTGESMGNCLFLSWFGPRGLASIVFAIHVLSHQVPEAEFLAVVVACTVLLSAVAHGLTAIPFTKWLIAKNQ